MNHESKKASLVHPVAEMITQPKRHVARLEGGPMRSVAKFQLHAPSDEIKAAVLRLVE